jgi:rhodanese-related sulfurtransferase
MTGWRSLPRLALGLTRIPLTHYVLASIVCMAPGTLAYTWLGHAGREAVAGDAGAIRYGLLALGLLAAIAFLPRLIRRLRKASDTVRTEAEDLRRQIDGGSPPTVLDVRGPDEFTGPLGHIPGALNIPLGEIESRLGELRGRAKDGIAVVCRTDKRSATARASLRAAGFDDVAVVRGGMERWSALGFETVDNELANVPATAKGQ